MPIGNVGLTLEPVRFIIVSDPEFEEKLLKTLYQMADNNHRAEQYLPKWVTTRFVVLDISGRWAAAVHRETLQRMEQSDRVREWVLEFETCTTARDVLMCCEMRNTVGLILFAEQLERECLSALRGLLRRMQTLPILLVCEEQHEELVPVMFEAGVQTVLYDVRNDVPIGQWCVSTLQRHCADSSVAAQ